VERHSELLLVSQDSLNRVAACFSRFADSLHVHAQTRQLYDGTMAHCGWWFVCALPDQRQRLSKALQFFLCLPYVGIIAAYDEGRAAACLGIHAPEGVHWEFVVIYMLRKINTHIHKHTHTYVQVEC
jgi:hypothetical protein